MERGGGVGNGDGVGGEKKRGGLRWSEEWRWHWERRWCWDRSWCWKRRGLASRGDKAGTATGNHFFIWKTHIKSSISTTKHRTRDKKIGKETVGRESAQEREGEGL